MNLSTKDNLTQPPSPIRQALRFTPFESLRVFDRAMSSVEWLRAMAGQEDAKKYLSTDPPAKVLYGGQVTPSEI